jgi:hypothetical protein
MPVRQSFAQLPGAALGTAPRAARERRARQPLGVLRRRRVSAWVRVLLLWLVWLLLPTPVHALGLRVERGVTCLEEGELRRALAQVAPATALEAPVQVELIGSAHDPRTVLMRVHHPDGAVFERTFSPAPERCPHLHQTLALALSLAIKAVPPAVAPTDDARPADGLVQGVVLGAGPLLGAGVGAGWAAGGELSTALTFRHAALRLLGWAAHASRVDLATGYFDSVSVAARLEGCARLAFRWSLHGELCLGAQAGRVYLRGGGLSRPLEDRLRLLGLGLDLGVEWRWRPGVQLRAGASLIAGLEPLEVVVRDENGAKQAEQRLPPVTGLFVLSLRYDFFTLRTARAKAWARSDMKE